VNTSYAHWHGFEADQVIGKKASEILADQNFSATEIESVQAGVLAGQRVDRERDHRHADGRISHLAVSMVPQFDDAGVVTGYYTFLHDVTDLKNAAQETSLARERLALALEGSDLCLWDWNLEEGTVYLDSQWSRMLGETPHETVLSAAELFDLVHPDDKDMLYARWQAVLKGEQAFYAVEHRVKTQTGEWLWIASLGKIVQQSADKKTLRMTGTNADISARKRAEAHIELLATTDPLTLLPNRRVLADRLAHGMLNVERTGRAAFALLFIDLDRFKHINDSLGHDIGDQVLKETAQRIGEATRKGDTVARLGGDEFAVVLAHMQKPEDAGPVAQKIIDALSEPYQLGEHTLNISCSIGVSVFPLDANDAPTLLRNADLAMYAAKEHGRHGYQYFSPAMNAQVIERVNLERALRDALVKDQFELYYQPKISFQTGQLAGVEALLRWHHPLQGQVSPARFIPIAEETRLILPIGEWILRTACAQLVAWQRRWQVELSLAVNISVVQIDRNLCQTISAALRHSGLEPRHLEIEITENVLLRNVSETIEILREISALGVRIAIDDFGTGYSSLSYLRDFKVDTIKIDQSFVGNMLTQEKDAVIVRTIIALGHSMKMRVVAEGVETIQQRDALQAMGCDKWQGYLQSKPLSAPEFERRMLASEVQT
jgi:diguanylate cyclase (GGDEF)-like protein/PAS domain S-box-containing protein